MVHIHSWNYHTKKKRQKDTKQNLRAFGCAAGEVWIVKKLLVCLGSGFYLFVVVVFQSKGNFLGLCELNLGREGVGRSVVTNVTPVAFRSIVLHLRRIRKLGQRLSRANVDLLRRSEKELLMGWSSRGGKWIHHPVQWPFIGFI